MERVTWRPTLMVRDHTGPSGRSLYGLQVCRAAYRNRTDDLRISRRVAYGAGLPPLTSPPGERSFSWPLIKTASRLSPGPSLALALAMVTRFRGRFCLTTWLQTTGTVLLVVERCSVVRVRLAIEDRRSAPGLLYFAAVQDDRHHLIRKLCHPRSLPARSLLSCRNSVHWCAVGGSVERPRAAKKRPARARPPG